MKSTVNYKNITIDNGTCLHFVSSEEAWADQVSVTVTVDFGSIHLACRDLCGNTYELPQGIAHFMEHLLFWLNFDEILLPLNYKYVAEPNSVVTNDLTRWGVKGALVDELKLHRTTPTDENRRTESVGDIVHSLLSILMPDDEVIERISKLLIDRTVNDIVNEISERHSGFIPHGNNDVNSKRDYVLKLKVIENLYICNPVQYDPLGTNQSLRTIEMNHIKLALRLIRYNIRSIIIVGWRLPERLITRTKQIVLDLLNRSSRSEKLYPITDVVEPLTIRKRIDNIENNLLGDYALALVGIKLLPLHEAFSSAEELHRMYLIAFLMMNRIMPGQIMISRFTRTYFIKGKVDDPLRLFLDPLQCAQVMSAHKTCLIDKLRSYQNNFNEEIEKIYTEVKSNSNTFIKLCNVADLFGCKVSQLLVQFEQISSVELESLIAELQDSRKNMTMVCAVKNLSFFEKFLI